MDTKTEKVLPDLSPVKKQMEATIDALMGCSDATPGIGLAIGGLRTAVHGIDGHLQVVAAKAKESAEKAEAAAAE